MYDLTFLKACFDVKEVLYAGVDGAICKAKLKAKKAGSIHRLHLGLQVNIRQRGKELHNEVKRLGYLKDRVCPLELRVGDVLIIYLSRTTS